MKLFFSSASILFFIALTSEVCFSYIKQTHYFADTNSAQRWYDEFWVSNSYNFRDEESRGDSNNDVFFIGDSFTAGTGIKDVNNRFSNIWCATNNRENKTYSCYNLGYEGLDTKLAYEEALLNFSKKANITPEYIVLQYFGNDIEQVAINNNPEDFNYENFQFEVNPLLKNSQVLNYLYWYYWFNPDFSPYYSFLENAYQNQEVLEKHEQDLAQFVNYCKINNCKLIVIIIPFLHDLAWSQRVYGAKIEDYFLAHKVPVINLANNEELKKMKYEDMIVHKNDYHANEKVQEIIAATLVYTFDRVF